MYYTFEDIIDKNHIKLRAERFWNEQNQIQRIKEGKKYIHACNGLHPIDWVYDFKHLNERQQNVIIKGELIRTYDNMLISDKKKLTNEACLSKFETKWYKMSPKDKNKILKHILT